ncbi:hypothetical protein [Streptomyces sp. NPDC005302]|uniref:hypothetical protein n=1 Tax=Streptomyces sp. NPDC005302 TaxID=3154675 RepID=UPI0033BC3CBF
MALGWMAATLFALAAFRNRPKRPRDHHECHGDSQDRPGLEGEIRAGCVAQGLGSCIVTQWALPPPVP